MVRAMKTPCRRLVPDLSSMVSVRETATKLLRDLPPRFALMGNSMGGYLALEMVRQSPGRITHLFLVGTNAQADPPHASEKRLQAIRLAEGGKMDSFVEGYVTGALHPDHVARHGQAMVAMAQALGPKALIHQQRAIMARRSSEDIVLTLNIPTAVVCGSHDAFSSPEQHAALAMAIEGASYHEIGECGHLVPLEAPEALAAVVDEVLAR
jgi:pimeloyl-ACP methyl ester carboxylesterase